MIIMKKLKHFTIIHPCEIIYSEFVYNVNEWSVIELGVLSMKSEYMYKANAQIKHFVQAVASHTTELGDIYLDEFA